MEYCSSYLSHIVSKHCTFKDQVANYNYMIKLAGNEDMFLATATLMCVHDGRNKETQNEFLTEWERNAVQYLNVFNIKKRKATNKKHYKGQRRIGRVYSLSGVFLDDGSSQYYVCKNAFRQVFDIGMYYHERIKKTVKDGNLVPSLHKLCGKDGNALLDPRVSDSLIAYLEVKKNRGRASCIKGGTYYNKNGASRG